MRTAITIEIDEDQLSTYTDERLALFWHVAQANPAPLEDLAAGELAEKVGREIIRRWLRAVSPELWKHQGKHHYWSELIKLATWESEDPNNSPGRWVPKANTEAKPVEK